MSKITIDLSKADALNAGVSLARIHTPTGDRFWAAYIHLGSGENSKVCLAHHPTPQGAINAAVKKAEDYARTIAAIINAL